MDIERGGREQVCERSTLLDRVIPLHQIFVSGGCPEQKDEIEPTGVPFNQRLLGFPVDVDALAIALAPFVEDENLFTLPLGCVQRRREQIGTVIQGVVDVVPVLNDQPGDLACPTW